jgi:HK97 family phage major capsid protein
MRRDDVQRLHEQRTELVELLRTTGQAAEEWKAENKEYDYRAEDKQELERIEKELISIQRSLEQHNKIENLAAWNPENAVSKNAEGAPNSLNMYRSNMYAQSLIQDLPDTRQAVYQWIVEGRETMDAEQYRVLSKAASGGGFFVPTDLADQIVRAMRFLPGGVGSLARTLTTATGDTVNVPLNLTHGTAAWIAESGSYTPSDETITNGTLSAYKAGAKIIVSEELLTDSAFDLSGFISTEFGERIGALAESAYISGDGSGKPTGILDASSSVTVSTLPAGYVTTLAWAGLATAIFSVPAQYRSNMAILAADSLWVKLVSTPDSTGAPLWNPSTASGAPDTFAGIPIYTHPNLAAVGANAKSMIVGDFNRAYWIRRVNGIYMQRQNELHSDNGQVGFRAYTRLDGKVVLADALRIVAFAAT